MATSSKHERHIEARQTARETFGLTPAEMRVAHIIANGNCPKIAARKLNISYHTVRNHLKIIFEKTDTHRQSALAVLLLRAGFFDELET